VEAAAETLVRAARQEARRRGVSIVFIVCLNRGVELTVNRPATDLLRRPIGAHLAGLDVAGDEAVPIGPLGDLIRPWQAAGRVVTLHAGEDPRGAGAASVREAVEVWRADRIGHGVRAAEDPATVAWLARKGIPLEAALTSNVQTRAVASYRTHPLGALLRAGVRVTLNSDDPVISGATLSEDYARAHERTGLNWDELRQLAIHGARAAFLPPAARAKLARRIAAAWVAPWACAPRH
jgi:adenosine deaminase